MKETFVDTSALYALFAPSDAKHGEASAILRELGRKKAALVTTDLVLIESYVLVHARTGRSGLLKFRGAIESSEWLRRVAPSAEHQAQGWRLLEGRSDKEYSFIDAVSFVVMRALGAEQAFTFDEHFKQEGFEVLKRPARSTRA